jgi:ferric-dicitrate binding protein FerR (iron transport regulator)
VGLWLVNSPHSASNEIVASVERVSGMAQSMDAKQQMHMLVADAPVREHDVITTATDARVAIKLGPGLAIRVDQNSQLQFSDAHHLTLRSGAVFIDSKPSQPNLPRLLIVTTPFGEVRHVGTQYESRLMPGALRIRVREGRVELESNSGNMRVQAGEQVVLSKGNISRTTVRSTDREWSWTQQITPLYAIENHTLDEFLNWQARETGRELVYATAAAGQAARETILHGSIAGLTPEAALPVVLSTTQFKLTQADHEVILELGS